MADKTVSEIIAGALDIFTRGPKGGRLKKARWITGSAVGKDDNGNETYCALGAISKADGALQAHDEYYRFSAAGKKAADLVISAVPESTKLKCGMARDETNGGEIPNWNDELSSHRGFVAIKRAFCKALKTSLAEEKALLLKKGAASHGARKPARARSR